jgi:hypothetical protein
MTLRIEGAILVRNTWGNDERRGWSVADCTETSPVAESRLINTQNHRKSPMNHANASRVTESIIDVSKFPFDLDQAGSAPPDATLVDAVVHAVGRKNGFAVLHGANKLLGARGLDVHSEIGAEAARRHYEAVFRSAVPRFDLSRYSPVKVAYDRIARMDVDGYNPNKHFTPNSDHTESREFVTTKCVHFDAATPFIANIYGPNQNIRGGLPMICDTRAFCADKGIDSKALIENIPNNYNVAVKLEYCEEILDRYSFALDVDLDNDVVAIVLYNEVIGGVAHAATQPERADATRPARRPIRHVELQVATTEDLKAWYEFYGLGLTKAVDNKADAGDVMFQRYHRGEAPSSVVPVSR